LRESLPFLFAAKGNTFLSIQKPES